MAAGWMLGVEQQQKLKEASLLTENSKTQKDHLL